MKRRWSILFWSALAALIGMSWLTRTLGIPMTALISASLLGMVAAAAMAFYAMVRNVPDKWPAAVTLICAGPMALQFMTSLPEISAIVHFLGLSYILILAGTAATVATSIAIIAAPALPPPRPPQVPPAQVV